MKSGKEHGNGDMDMNRKRLEHIAGILRDAGLAALIGGVGDAAVNQSSGRGSLDAWGMVCGIVVLAVSVYAIGLEPNHRRA